MCGIAGALGRGEIDRQTIKNMLQRIKHRGSDGCNTWSDAESHVVLGHNRLAIIDLSLRSEQPVANFDKSVYVAFNGEVYNFVELRAGLIKRGYKFQSDGDAEVIANLYSEYKERFVYFLRGMFAIALWDLKTRRLILARDRLGKKPLFWTKTRDGQFLFASEIKAFKGISGVDFGLSESGLSDYLKYGSSQGSQTIYGGIKKLKPGTVLEVYDRELAEKSFWSIGKQRSVDNDKNPPVSRLYGELKEAVRLRLRSDVPLGCFLSGGIDSGLVAAIASKELDEPLNTFCVGFEDSLFDERPMAALTARHLKTNHQDILLRPDLGLISDIVRHFDEPFASPSAIPSFFVAKAAAERGLKVVLNGDGADEVFCGYRHFRAMKIAEALRLLSGGKFASFINGMANGLSSMMPSLPIFDHINRLTKSLTYGDLQQQYDSLVYNLFSAQELEEWLVATSPRWQSSTAPSSSINAKNALAEHLSIVDLTTLFDLQTILPDEHLVKMDRMSMFHTIEARSPFLDHKVVEFGFNLDERDKFRFGQTKPLLRSLAADLLPPEITSAPKRGFEIPLQSWLNRELSQELYDRLLASDSLARQLFDAKKLEIFLSSQGAYSKNWARKAWALLCLEYWHDEALS